MPDPNPTPFVKVRSMSVSYGEGGLLGRKRFAAVSRVTFDIQKNSCFALVGESGSGKTTVAKALLSLARIDSGSATIGDFRLPGLKGKRLMQFRDEVQAVFQDPYLSLNPRLTVRRQIEEPLIIRGIPTTQRIQRLDQVLQQVRLDTACLNKRPAQLSGGQRQRVCIARSLMPSPGLLIADEPVSALDLSVQGQVIDLLNDLKAQCNLTLLFVSHDVELVQFMADTVGVMYAGRMVELGPANLVLRNPLHPYTQALLAATPGALAATGLEAGAPPPLNKSGIGCPFQPHCGLSDMKCEFQEAPLIMVNPEHRVACYKTAGVAYR